MQEGNTYPRMSLNKSNFIFGISTYIYKYEVLAHRYTKCEMYVYECEM